MYGGGPSIVFGAAPRRRGPGARSSGQGGAAGRSFDAISGCVGAGCVATVPWLGGSCEKGCSSYLQYFRYLAEVGVSSCSHTINSTDRPRLNRTGLGGRGIGS
jgi:hypothetical protein